MPNVHVSHQYQYGVQLRFGIAMPSLGLIPTPCLNHFGVLHLYLCSVDCLMRKTECIDTLQILLKNKSSTLKLRSLQSELSILVFDSAFSKCKLQANIYLH